MTTITIEIGMSDQVMTNGKTMPRPHYIITVGDEPPITFRSGDLFSAKDEATGAAIAMVIGSAFA